MLSHLRKIGLVVIAILIFGNGYFFLKTMLLGDRLLRMEQEIKQLKLANTELATKLSSLNSLQRLRKVAFQLGFTKKQDLLYLDNLQYALRYD